MTSNASAIPLLPLLCAALFCAGAAAQDPEAVVESLVGMADPLADDWATESDQVHCKRQLGRLAGWLESGRWTEDDVRSVLMQRARSTPLRGSKTGSTEVGRMKAVHGEATGAKTGPADAALHALFPPTAAGEERSVRFKIVGVESGDRGPNTRVRVEVGASRVGAVSQQVALWSVAWERGEGARPPRIASIRLERFEGLAADGFLFSDSTASVLGPSADGASDLALGGEHWYGRIDALGEPNLMGHNGIALGDANGDGLDDVYVAAGTGLPNRLLLRGTDGTVRDVAAAAGVAWLDDTKGALFADMDNDGDQDLLLAMGPTIVLCKNDGQGKFGGFVGMRAPTPAAFYSISVADYDLDGDLDIYGTRYVKLAYGVSVPLPFHDANNGPTNHLLRNEGDDRYRDVTREVGLGVNNERFSLAGAWADYDADGDPDLYVANDFGRNNLYRNDAGTFVDVAAEAGVEDQAAGMGAAWSDYDLDGDLDLYVSNMYSAAGSRVAYQSRFQAEAPGEERREIQAFALGNTLLRNRGDGTFEDVSATAGVRMGRWAWGSRFTDFNNDGYDDLVVQNGFLTGALEDDL
ncbi:MAG: VCBS repeat-containing protein [bacterium]|nr:VCBS repeat-containing protein [bacterium]